MLARKGNGKEAKLSYNGNLTENRYGLIVNTEVLQANGTAERDAIVEELCPGNKLDVFGREQRKGWQVWGAEQDVFGAAS